MLVDELRDLTNNSKQYQEEYEEIVRKLREIAANGLNEITIMDVSNVVSIRNMFKYCENFNCDLSNWDVSKVKDMTNIFYGCIALKNKPSWCEE